MKTCGELNALESTVLWDEMQCCPINVDRLIGGT
jgi:hypothetical protein